MAWPAPARGETRFKLDDPLLREPPPLNVKEPLDRDIDDLYDFAKHTFATPRRYEDAAKLGKVGPAGDVNTLGEVLEGPWYTNRHYHRRMTLKELLRGPGNATPPSATGQWIVTAAKSDGVTPGFRIKDDKGNRYLLKFDPVDAPELASGADIIGSKIFHALGYHTPENYIVNFDISRLAVDPKATYKDANDRTASLTLAYVKRLLYGQPKDRQGRYRALASRFITGQPIGPFRYSGLRTDDPNDIVPHEDRRSLRGLGLFSAWQNHTDSRAKNTLDVVVKEDGRTFIRHYLIDFGSTLGSDSIFIKEATRGHVYDIEPAWMGKQLITFGLLLPDWMRVDVPKLRGIGRFESAAFRPREWKPGYPNPAFLRMDEQDAFWAARQVAALTNEELDALATVAEYTNPESTEYMGRILRERRDKVIHAYLDLPLRLDRFRVEGGALAFDDLGRMYAKREARHEIAWAEFDNRTGERKAWSAAGESIPEAAGSLPANGVFVARITEPGLANLYVDVFLRRSGDGLKVVGVERRW